jgi:hypothetical protein
MKVKWTLEEGRATIELLPETMIEKMMLDGLSSIQTAQVKVNGALQFIMLIPAAST